MDDKFKQLAKAIVSEQVRANKDPEVYIASPFFDEVSKEYVTCKETEFDGMNIPYYSPRQDNINFNEVSGQLRSERIKAIFKNNVRNLNKCTHICVNLLPCNGRLDIGTLWELGYFIGKHGDPNFDEDEYSTLLANENVKDLITLINSNLVSVNKIDTPVNSKLLLVKNTSIDKVKDSLDIMGMDMDVMEVSSILNTKNVNSYLNYSKVIFLTDEFPMQSFILMGYMYAIGVGYYTASYKNYGSNVMIAASSKGHIQLPGLVDDTYRQDMK